jgi:hypothetical protein
MAVRPVQALLPPSKNFAVLYILFVTFLNVVTIVRNAYSVANVFATSPSPSRCTLCIAGLKTEEIRSRCPSSP